MANTTTVLGIGNAIVDIIARCDDEFLSQNELPKGHMSLIDTDRAKELYSKMGPATEMSGGSAANTMVGIASLGGDASFIGKVSDDELGRIFAHDIKASGVEFGTTKSSGGDPTARCYVFVTPDGERTMNTYLGVSPHLNNGEVDHDSVKDANILYLEGYLFDRDDAKAAFHEASKTASQNKTKVALSLSDAFCVDRHRDDFRKLIKTRIDILFANEEELKSLAQSDNLEEAQSELGKDCELTALTLGAQGSVIVSGDQRIAVPAQPVDEVVDTTGAGDLYAAGFLHGLTQGLELAQCGKLGSIASGEIISHIGARPQTPLDRLARENGISV